MVNPEHLRYPILMNATIKNPELYAYTPSHINEAIRGKDANAAATEVAEQIYTLPLLAPDFCKKLITELENSGQWEAGLKVDFYQPDEEDEDAAPPSGPKNGISLAKLPGLSEVYNEIVDRHVAPVVKNIWQSFEMQMYRTPYMIKYDADGDAYPKGMGMHWDQCGVSMFVSLNDDFEGGGTSFPRWDYQTGILPAGTALLFPGGISHEHEGKEITKGLRYLLICDYF